MTASPIADDRASSHDSALTQTAIVYGLLCIAAVVVFFDTAQSLVHVWWGTPTFNHGFFVAPMAIYLMWMRRDELRGLPVRQEPLALLLMLGCGVVWLVGYAGDVRLFQHMGFVGLLIVMAGGLFGRHILRKAWFPILFLGFMVPVGDQLVPPLQDLTADFSVFMLGVTNIPVWRDGVFLEISNGRFEVAEACAGVRFLIANIVVATVFAYLAYTKWWKWALFILISVLVPIVANGFRAFGIIYIAHTTDNEYAVGVDHLVYGWGFFTVIMLLCLFIGNLFADRRVGDFEEVPESVSARVPQWSWGFVAAAAGLMALGPAYAAAVMDSSPWQGEPNLRPPEIADRWQPAEQIGEKWHPVFVGSSGELLETYSDGEDTVGLYVAYYPAQGQGAEVIYHANRFANDEEWKRLETRRMTIEVDGQPLVVRLERMQTNLKEKRVAAYWYWIAGRSTSDAIEAKLYQVAGALTSGDRSAAVIAVTMLEPESREELQATIQRFVNDMPNLNAYVAGLRN